MPQPGVVQTQLENHQLAAEAYHRFAASPDWGTTIAAIPASGLVGAAGNSLSAWLSSQAAYAAARSTFTGWLFGVAAPASFAATVLPVAVPAALGVAWTGYSYWRGKTERDDALNK